MFQTHDHVVHPRHGVGTITGTRMIDLDGEKRRYYCITLVKNESIVMVAADHLEDSGLRPASLDTALIRRIMAEAPEELPENNRIRETETKKLLDGASPITVLGLLRDLEWHGHQHKLTAADRRIQHRASEMITNELALHTDMDVSAAQQVLTTIMDETIIPEPDEPVVGD
ncbi:MAG: hypothetical protein JXN59_13425 [Anaerolineae bacterium]|nr:hypothetical protein [Anaerolineae bacterium]